MKRFIFFLLLILFTAACTEPAVDTFGNIGGTVSDASSGNRLSGVLVVLTPTGYSQVTNSEGVFQFDNLDVQEYTLTFSREGYQSFQHKVTVKPGLSSSVQVNLKISDITLPTVVMGNSTNLTANSIRLHATLSSVGSSAVTQHGFCYAEHALPTTADKCINLGSATGAGQFAQNVTDLEPSTVYYFRAYAQNGGGLVYSDEIEITTPASGSGDDEESGIVVASGLMLYYTFDNEDFKDSTEMGVDGQGVEEPSFLDDTPSGQGKSVFINGTKSQYIAINYNLFKGLSNYSIALWVKDFSTGSIVSGIYGSDYNNAEWQYYPRVYFTADGKISFSCGNGYYLSTSPTFSYSYSAIQADSWHHVAVTCANGALKLYIDGILMDTINGQWSDPKDNTPKVHIGGNGNGIYPVFFTGKLDNVRLYNRTITDNNVQEIYDAEK